MKLDWHFGYITIILLAALVIWINVGDGQTKEWQLQNLGKSIKAQATQIALKDHQLDSLTHAQRKLDTIYITQRIAFSTADSAYRSATTKTVHDTVWVPKAVADADVKACSVVLLTCAQRAAVAEQRADSAKVAEDLAKDNAKKAQAVADGVTVQARHQKWTWGLVGYGAGTLTCNLLPLLHGRN